MSQTQKESKTEIHTVTISEPVFKHIKMVAENDLKKAIDHLTLSEASQVIKAGIARCSSIGGGRVSLAEQVIIEHDSAVDSHAKTAQVLVVHVEGVERTIRSLLRKSSKISQTFRYQEAL